MTNFSENDLYLDVIDYLKGVHQDGVLGAFPPLKLDLDDSYAFVFRNEKTEEFHYMIFNNGVINELSDTGCVFATQSLQLAIKRQFAFHFHGVEWKDPVFVPNSIFTPSYINGLFL